MSRDCFYITTPIYYVNAVPHIGNAYTTVCCDVLARFNRLRGRDVVFATGTDEHAQKVLESAQSSNQSVRDYVDAMEPKFREQWSALEITFDDYIRTPEKRHVDMVQKIFKRLLEQDDIYLGQYEGLYCVSDETFFTQSEAPDGICPNPECGKPLNKVKEDNYFFRLSKYQERLLDYMTSNPGWLRPDYRANEVVAFTRSGLNDQSVSRINNGWGIPVPGDERHVIYVWFDALLNYLTVAGYLQDDEKFSKVWPPSVQMMGKDIFVRFHCTLWPAMLMALDLPLPEMLVGHGFWTIEGDKIGKSKGNAVYATQLVKDVSAISGADESIAADSARYFLCREVPFGADGDFSMQALVGRFNSDLANDLGNLLNRTLSMLHKYFGGVIPPCSALDDNLKSIVSQAAENAAAAFDEVQLSKALDAIWTVVSAGNKYVDASAPWALHREGKEEQLANVLYNTLETARVVTVMVSPFMPSAAVRMWRQLGLEGNPTDMFWEDALQYGRLKPGTQTRTADPVFPRIDLNKLESLMPKPKADQSEIKTDKKEAARSVIQFDDFKKLDIRVARILTAEAVEGADKLLKLSVDVGEESPRQVVAGIAKYYSIEKLVGRTAILLANLAPAKIRGVESQGMLLAADVDGEAILLQPDPDKDTPPAGSIVR